jgi:hypothetical protein
MSPTTAVSRALRWAVRTVAQAGTIGIIGVDRRPGRPSHRRGDEQEPRDPRGQLQPPPLHPRASRRAPRGDRRSTARERPTPGDRRVRAAVPTNFAEPITQHTTAAPRAGLGERREHDDSTTSTTSTKTLAPGIERQARNDRDANPTPGRDPADAPSTSSCRYTNSGDVTRAVLRRARSSPRQFEVERQRWLYRRVRSRSSMAYGQSCSAHSDPSAAGLASRRVADRAARAANREPSTSLLGKTVIIRGVTQSPGPTGTRMAAPGTSHLDVAQP